MSRISLVTMSIVVGGLALCGSTASAAGVCSPSTPQYCPAPAVQTSATTLITMTTAQLTGTVNPNGATTQCAFAYGPTTNYNQRTPQQAFSASTSVLAVTATITGLTPSTTYHDALICFNAGGFGSATDVSFTTLSVSKPKPKPTVRSKLSIGKLKESVSKSGVVKFPINCKSTVTCKGTLSLTSLKGKKFANSVGYTIRAQKGKTISMKLTKTTLKGLRKAKHRHMKARLKAADRDHGTASGVVTLTLK
jgi:hypothetical protein